MSSSSSGAARSGNGETTKERMVQHNSSTPKYAPSEYKRTRSKLALPEFDPDLARSPLKNARDAIRKANSRKVQSALDASVEQDHVDLPSRNAKHSVFMNRSLSPSETVVATEETSNMQSEAREEGKGTLNGVFDLPQVNLWQSTMKRARSPSVDEEHFGHSLSKSTAFPSTASQAVVDRNSTISASKRQKSAAELQGTLDMFFTKPKSDTAAIHGVQKRIFGDFSHQLNDSYKSPSKDREKMPVPPTPTLKQLREMPELDLRTMTPSPRKAALQSHGLASSANSPKLKSRSISEQITSSAKDMDVDLGTDDNRDILKESDSVGLNEGQERQSTKYTSGADGMEQNLIPPLNPNSMPSWPSTPRDKNTTIAENTSHHQAKEPKSIISHDGSTPIGDTTEGSKSVSNPISDTSTIPIVNVVSLDSEYQSKDLDDTQIKLGPSSVSSTLAVPETPRHRIIRSFPSKQHLFDMNSLSPLTPLPEQLGKHSVDDYDYEAEEAEIKALGFSEGDKGQPKKVVEKSGGVPISETEQLTNEGQENSYIPMVTDTQKGGTNTINKEEDVDWDKQETGMQPKTKVKSSSPNFNSSSISPSSHNTTGAKMKSRAQRKVIPSSPSKMKGRMGLTPRRPMTRAALLRQKEMQHKVRASPTKPRISLAPIPMVKKREELKEDEKGKEDDANESLIKSRIQTPKQNSSGPSLKEKQPSNDGKAVEKPLPSRKPFVLTVPSSLSPIKASTSSSTSIPRPRFDSRPLSLYPPNVQDPTAKANAQRTLSNLSNALEKLRMPPPSKTTSETPISDRVDNEKARPATSLGFTHEVNESINGVASSKTNKISRPLNRAGSAEPASKSKTIPTSGSTPSMPMSETRTRTLFGGFKSIPKQGNSVGTLSRIPSLGQAGPSRNIFGRPVPRMRASQKTTLETVEGSPVKGPTPFKIPQNDEIEVDEGTFSKTSERLATARTANVDTSLTSDDSFVHTAAGNGESPISANSSMEEGRTADGKELKKISKLNASRRASMAFSALTESLNTSIAASTPSPVQTSPGSEVLSASHKNMRVGSLARPVRAASVIGRTRSDSAEVETNIRDKIIPASGTESESDTGRSGRRSAMGRTKMPGSLDVLNHCTIFVDVRTEEGEDAGALFVDMLRGMGAKVLSRVGQTCTHIVYKNGLSSTLTRYRLLDEPRPIVVGIGWVVECVEKREWINETRFRVDIEGINVAGSLKRRRSLLPKQMAPASGPMDNFLNGSSSIQTVGPPKVAIDSDPPNDEGERTGSNLKSNLNPLEQARRRSVMVNRTTNS